MKEMVGGCCVCSDDRGWAENPLVYCDGQGCTVAVHQACYGIVTVPTGNWYCRKCESQERSVRIGPRQHCELCPSRDGALKRTDNSGWAHVVCALYIPEVRFGNVTTMEPILLQQIPAERFNKVCYICEESGKGNRSTIGACMQCNKSGCKQQFHVTCAQALGLLCEEAGNYLDNVKYCGYCQHHYSKLKKGGNVKTIPPYRPVTIDNSDLSSPEKEPSENWSKSSAKRKPSTNSNKNNTIVPSSGTKSVVTAIKSETSPGPSVIAEPAGPTPVDEIPAAASTPPVSTPQTKDLILSNTKSDPASSGKFTTSNFVESVVTPSDSVFGDTGKSGKKRKSQSVQLVKEETTVQPASVISTNTSIALPVDDINKRLKIDPVIVVKTESPNPSVVVKVQTTTPPSTSPSLTPPISKVAVTTSSPLTVTSSIVVSVPLTAAAIPPNAVTTTPTPPTTPVEEPAKRGRSQSSEKTDKGRKQKRGNSNSTGKRGSRSNQVSPPSGQPPLTVSSQMTTMAPIVPTTASTTTTVVTHSSTTPSPALKESPPSSPETSRRSGQRSRKQPTPNQPPPSRDDRDSRFQNGVSAPHMLGNQLNPASTMAQKMSDTLNQELEAHSIFTSEANLSAGQLIGPQLHSRVIASARSTGSGSSANSTPHSSATPPAIPTASTSSNLGVNWGSNANITPQTLDQLLERQWEQGSQFLMEQAQHFDIASLLSCLHQLRAENLRLEEHVSSLLQRRDHLLAVNARLAIPLIPTTPIVNNIHPATTVAVDTTRNTSSQSGRVNNSYMTQSGAMPLENGPPPSPPPQPQYHRTPVTQPSPNTASSRHHSPGSSQGYVMHPSSTASGPGVVVRGSGSVPAEPLRSDSRRSSSQSSNSHQQGYSAMYQVPTQQPQIVMRREVTDLHHQNSSSKPS